MRFVAEGWRFQRPDVKKKDGNKTIHCKVEKGQTDGFHEAWKYFLFNVEKVRQVTDTIDEGEKAEILAAGALWKGSGWNSSSASKRLYDLTSVPILS